MTVGHPVSSPKRGHRPQNHPMPQSPYQRGLLLREETEVCVSISERQGTRGMMTGRSGTAGAPPRSKEVTGLNPDVIPVKMVR